MWCDVDVSPPRDWLPRRDVDAVSSWAESMSACGWKLSTVTMLV